MTLDELTKPLTKEEVTAALYAAAAARGLSTTTWKPGAVVRTIIAALAIVLAAFSRLQAEIAKSGFLVRAAGAWLTLVARYVYNVERDTGSFATGSVTLDNAGAGVYSGDPGDLVVVNPTSDKTYRNTAAFSLSAMQQNVVVPIRAVELGTPSNSSAGTITAFETPLLGVTVTNDAAVLGTDAEEDDDLRVRCLEKTAVASPNGPRDAYAYVARSAKRADGTSIGVTRVRCVADGLGGVAVYVADADGVVVGPVDDPASDLYAINDAIQKRVVPLGVTATVISATPVEVAPTYELWITDTSSLTDEQIEAVVQERLDEFISSRPIGGDVIPSDVGRVYVSLLQTVIGGALPETIRVAVTLPASDLALAINEVPVSGDATATAIHRVPGPVL